MHTKIPVTQYTNIEDSKDEYWTEGFQDRLANHILFYAKRLPSVCLYTGKMGVVLALSEYYIRRPNEILDDLIQHLLSDVYDGITDCMPFGLENGLAGIGYALTLLSMKGYLSDDINESLKDIDERIMFTNPKRCRDMSFRRGLAGIWSYVELRRKMMPLTTFDDDYLRELKEALKMNGVIDRVNTLYEDLDKPMFESREYINSPICLNGGSSFYLFTGKYD